MSNAADRPYACVHDRDRYGLLYRIVVDGTEVGTVRRTTSWSSAFRWEGKPASDDDRPDVFGSRLKDVAATLVDRSRSG